MPADEADLRLLVIGAGAQTKYVLETCIQRDDEVVAVMNWGEAAEIDHLGPLTPDVFGLDPDLSFHSRIDATHFIVCTPDAERKAAYFGRAEALGLKPYTAIHPRAVVAATATIGSGSIVNANAVIQPFARIGAGVMIHAGVVVEHDCVVEDYANLAPGARLAGWCRIGTGATVFTGANLIPSIQVGAHAIVAAGATVVRNVPAGIKVAGTPAKPMGGTGRNGGFGQTGGGSEI